MKIPLSLVIISLNEEKNIKACIESCDFVDEIIILDSNSQDQTVKIAESLGAKVFQQSWLGFGPQKHLAAEKAKNDWILSLDADERVSKELKTEILQKFSSLNPAVAYRAPRISFYLQKWIRRGGWYPDLQTRLFNRKFSQWNKSLIHEKVEASAFQELQHNIEHYVFSGLSDQVQTNNRYSELQAIEMHKSGKSFSYFHLMTKPFVKFVECYFLKAGFLDGMAGFLIAKNASYSVFLKWAKLWELGLKK